MTDQRNSTAIVVLIALFLFMLTFNPDLIGYDDGIILTGAARVLRGDIPYADFWSMYGPATFYVNAGVMAVFGDYALAVKLVSLLVKLGLVYLTVLFVAQYQPVRLQVIGGLTAASLLIGFGFDLFPAFHALFLILLAFWFLTHFPKVVLGGAAAGVALGLAALFRHDLAGYALVCVVIYFLVRLRAPSQRFGSRSRLGLVFLWMVVACAAVFVPAVLALVAAADVERLFHDLIFFPGTVYPEMRGLPWPVWPVEQLVVYAPFLAPLVFLAVSRRDLEARSSGRDRYGLLLLLMLASVLFIFKGVVRTVPIHMAPAILTFNMLLFCCFPCLSSGRKTGGRAVLFAAIAAFLILWTPLFAYNKSTLPTVTYWQYQTARTLQACRQPVHPRLTCMAIPERFELALAEMPRLHAEGEPIYVGVDDHSRIFQNFQAFYFLLGSFSPSEWEELHPGLQDQRDVQAQMIAAFSETPPRVVLLDGAWASRREPNGSSVSSGVHLLDAFLRENYVVVKKIGSLEILVPKAGQQ